MFLRLKGNPVARSWENSCRWKMSPDFTNDTTQVTWGSLTQGCGPLEKIKPAFLARVLSGIVQKALL